MAITLNGSTGIVEANIADSAITSNKIAAGAVAVSDLASTLDLSSKSITLPTGMSNKIRQTIQVYQSSSRLAFSGEGGTNLTADFHYPLSGRIGGTFTKQSSTSYILVIAHLSVGAMTNTHDLYMWDVGSSDFRHLGFDAYRADNNRLACTFSQTFTGLPAGSRTIYMAAGAGDTRSWSGVLNFNPEADGGNGDTANTPTTSQMIVMEIEP